MAELKPDLEKAARLAMAESEGNDPLPPGPNYGPFGYWRLALLIFAALVAVLAVMTLM